MQLLLQSRTSKWNSKNRYFPTCHLKCEKYSSNIFFFIFLSTRTWKLGHSYYSCVVFLTPLLFIMLENLSQINKLCLRKQTICSESIQRVIHPNINHIQTHMSKDINFIQFNFQIRYILRNQGVCVSENSLLHVEIYYCNLWGQGVKLSKLNSTTFFYSG